MAEKLYYRFGRKIKKIRQENNKTLDEIASAAEVSKGLLSKIENGRTIPSLPVLLQILKAIKTDLNVFFNDFSYNGSYSYIHKKASDYTLDEKEDSEGFAYFSIMSEDLQKLVFQSSILKLEPGAIREKVTTDGFTFIYLIEGQVDYVLENETISLNTSDSLFFDGRIPHVPQNNTDRTAILLVIYLLTS
ncbi:MAG: helix-turn-helix domain-containing protein [Bacteroidota bacterium]